MPSLPQLNRHSCVESVAGAGRLISSHTMRRGRLGETTNGAGSLQDPLMFQPQPDLDLLFLLPPIRTDIFRVQSTMIEFLRLSRQQHVYSFTNLYSLVVR